MCDKCIEAYDNYYGSYKKQEAVYHDLTKNGLNDIEANKHLKLFLKFEKALCRIYFKDLKQCKDRR